MTWLQKNRKLVAVLGVVLLPFLIFMAYMREERERTWLDRGLVGATGWLNASVVTLIEGISSIGRHYLALVGVQEENDALIKQLAGSESKLNGLPELQAENERLRSLLRMRANLPEGPVVAARVVGLGGSLSARTLRINVGSSQGVVIGCVVVATEGLVGRVSLVTPYQSEVTLLTDPRSTVDIVTAVTRARGIMHGRGSNERCPVDYMVKNTPPQEGEKAFTSGFGGRYPTGLYVGTLQEIHKPPVGLFLEANLKPSVVFSSLEEVLVLPAPPDRPAKGSTP